MRNERGAVKVVTLTVLLMLLLAGGCVVWMKGQTSGGLLNGLLGRTDLETAREEANQAESEKEAAWFNYQSEEERTQQLGLEAEIKRAEGDNMIKRSVAQSLTWQTRMHIGLQLVMAAFACCGFGMALVFVADRLLR